MSQGVCKGLVSVITSSSNDMSVYMMVAEDIHHGSYKAMTLRQQKDPTHHGFWNPPCLGHQNAGSPYVHVVFLGPWIWPYKP